MEKETTVKHRCFGPGEPPCDCVWEEPDPIGAIGKWAEDWRKSVYDEKDGLGGEVRMALLNTFCAWAEGFISNVETKAYRRGQNDQMEIERIIRAQEPKCPMRCCDGLPKAV
jgi:hypothetical protein